MPELGFAEKIKMADVNGFFLFQFGSQFAIDEAE